MGLTMLSCDVCGIPCQRASTCTDCYGWAWREINKMVTAPPLETAPDSTKFNMDVVCHQGVPANLVLLTGPPLTTIPIHGEPSPVTGKKGFSTTSPAAAEEHERSNRHLENRKVHLGQYDGWAWRDLGVE